MKKILLLVFLFALGFIWMRRERVFVRDPLASVYVNGGKQSGAQVFINYSDDILIERDASPGAYQILVQGWNRMPGTPALLQCVRWMACMTEADHATTTPLDWSGKGAYDPKVTMTEREVSFADGAGATVRVTLR